MTTTKPNRAGRRARAVAELRAEAMDAPLLAVDAALVVLRAVAYFWAAARRFSIFSRSSNSTL